MRFDTPYGQNIAPTSLLCENSSVGDRDGLELGRIDWCRREVWFSKADMEPARPGGGQIDPSVAPTVAPLDMTSLTQRLGGIYADYWAHRRREDLRGLQFAA